MQSLYRFRSGLAVLLFGLALVTAARAQVTFTIIATAGSDTNTTGNGYVANNPYTFVFTMPGGYPNNPDSVFSTPGQIALWKDEVTTTDANLFTSISGSGLGGTFVRPTTTIFSPFSTVETIGGSLDIAAESDDSTPNSIGLTSLTSTALGSIVVHIDNSAAFTQGGSYVAPATYFAPYAGIYGSATGTLVLLNGNSLIAGDFTVKSLTISATAIPEPATTAGLIGLAGFGAVLLARRRRAA